MGFVNEVLLFYTDCNKNLYFICIHFYTFIASGPNNSKHNRSQMKFLFKTIVLYKTRAKAEFYTWEHKSTFPYRVCPAEHTQAGLSG